MSVGDVIREERLSQLLTLEDMGGAVFKAHATICGWESGRVNVKSCDIPRICKFLNISPNQLFEWEDVEPKTDKDVLEFIYLLTRRRRGK